MERNHFNISRNVFTYSSIIFRSSFSTISGVSKYPQYFRCGLLKLLWSHIFTFSCFSRTWKGATLLPSKLSIIPQDSMAITKSARSLPEPLPKRLKTYLTILLRMLSFGILNETYSSNVFALMEDCLPIFLYYSFASFFISKIWG